MNACPKANITDINDKLQEENLYLITEVTEGLSLWTCKFEMVGINNYNVYISNFGLG